MGKVFAPEVVQAGHVPEPGAHQAAGRTILETLGYPYRWSNMNNFERLEEVYDFERLAHIDGVMVYGSTALGTADIRSDVDVLFTYPSIDANSPPSLGKYGLLRAVGEVFKFVEDTYHTPIEPSPYADNALSNPLLHTIDPGFALHLHAVQNMENPQWSYNWPVTQLFGRAGKPEIQDRLRPATIRFIAHKQKRFARSIVDYRGQVDFDSFQRAFELPFAIGRKILSLDPTDESGIQASSNRSGTVEMIAERMEQLSEDWPFSKVAHLQDNWGKQHFRRLVELDREYTDILQQTVDGRVPIERYKNWLDFNYLDALARAQTISSFWLRVLLEKYDLRDRDSELTELRADEEAMRLQLEKGENTEDLADFDY